MEPERWLCACVCVHLFVGDDVTESKHRIWEETILDLKQQMSTMQQRINDLKHENEELKKAQRSLATVKKGILTTHTPQHYKVSNLLLKRTNNN